MRNFLLSLLLALVGHMSGQVTIAGLVIDGGNQRPVAYATVSLVAPDSSLLGGVLTDDGGRFVLNTDRRGTLTVMVSYLGYRPVNKNLYIGENNNVYDSGKLSLVPDAQTLEAVTVTGERATLSSALDKKTFDLGERQAQAGGSVLDAMKALPGVTLTQDGNVQLRGSDRVAVLVDGKQSAMTGYGNQRGLGSIPAANIERIEIINNPSAKYDAAGMAGIINIIYKEEKSTGFNGEVGLSYALGELTTRRDDLPTELGRYRLNSHLQPNAALNYRSGKLRSWVQGSVLAQQKLPNNEFTTRIYDDGRRTISQVPENRKQIHYVTRGGLDYLFDEQNTLSISGIYDYEHHIDTAQIPFINLNTGERYRYWNWKEDESTSLVNGRVDFQHDFDQPGHRLTLATQFTRGKEDEQYFLNDSTRFRQAQDTSHLIAIENVSAFNVDYVRPLAAGRIEAGGQLRFRRLPVSYEIGQGERSIIYPGLGDASRWTEDLYAGYLNYVYESAHFEAEAGLRAEQTAVTYALSPENVYYEEDDAYDYFRVYPNVRLTYKLDETNKLSLFFNRRVDRPGEQELRAFAKYDDPELLKVGNPYLRPQFSQTVELAYRRLWDDGSMYAAVYTRRSDDAFQRIFSIDTSNPDYDIINRIYQNTGRATNRGVELLYSQEVKQWWKYSLGANFYRIGIQEYTGTLLFPTVRPFTLAASNDNSWDVKFNNQFTFTKGWKGQLTAIYLAARNIPQGRELARSSVDFAVSRTVFSGKGEYVLAATDIFNGFGLRQEIDGEGFTAEYRNYYESQVVRLGFTYKW
ncbi:outer membrane beta-barrel family protein [Lewinella sp. JB7]|uniref:outer membrane beta-barrel family protein n=1 Tax=Lewinella sp. JB7 TaxID=2962887 RepID=UPI0020C96FAC|nr:outer membrane beta-barrel family protein [Lewinella sp. JB7]MCP9234736.1 TonB-dependent receptor family protein [Lewinella sp. JB7]